MIATSRRKPRFAAIAAIAVASGVLQFGCATPIRPSGGPVDTIAPHVVSSTPSNGDVRVTADRLVLEFSERLDEASAARAVTISPEFDRAPRIEARGRRVSVIFPDSLHAQTTYVVSVGTTLRDEHGVALQRPLTLAFATGDVLDRGSIGGQLVDPVTQAGVGGFHVFAYYLPDFAETVQDENFRPDSMGAPIGGQNPTLGLPDPRVDSPSFSTETSSDGSFQLDYLREGGYFLVALDDVNRNRRADAGERFGLAADPVHQAWPDTSLSGAARPLKLFTTAVDTTAPDLRRARALSNQRLVLTLDEPVRLQSLSVLDWSLSDSTSGERVPISSVYQRVGSPTDVIIATGDPMRQTVHSLRSTVPIVVDSSGNASTISASITPSSAPDTLSLRFEGFLPSGTSADSIFVLRPDALPGVRFNQPVDSLSIRRTVVVTGPSGDVPFHTGTLDGSSYRLQMDSTPESFRIDVRMPDSTFTRRFSVPQPNDLGSISGRIAGHEGLAAIAEAYPSQGPPYSTSVDASGGFLLARLPPGSYRVRVFLDTDGNGRWDGGSLSPHRAPEPIRWLATPVSVRARWDHVIEEATDFDSQ